jgi:uncharacterized protein
VWLATNNFKSKFWYDASDFQGNRSLLLADLLRASTAAPYYFNAPSPSRGLGVSIDAGVSPHNNPSLLMLMVAVAKGSAFNWPLGDDKLLLISVGTGSFRSRMEAHRTAAGFAVDALQTIITDGSTHTLAVMQWISKSNRRWGINAEIDTLDEDWDHFPGGKPFLWFERFDLVLESRWLQRELGAQIEDHRVREYQGIDFVAGMPGLYDLASQAAARSVNDNSFPAEFNTI